MGACSSDLSMGPPPWQALSRRAVIRTGCGLAAGTGIAGCTRDRGAGDVGVITPTASGGGDDGTDSPDGASPEVYVPSHVHERTVVGTTASGGYAFGLAYSVPDAYWTVDGGTVREVTPAGDDNLQLMASVWASDTEVVLPGLELRAAVEKDGDVVAEKRLVPLLNQRWGFHYVANIGLDRYGEVTVRLAAPPTDVRRTGAFPGSFDDPARARLDLTFSRAEARNLRTLYPRSSGEAGAVRAASVGEIPNGRQPDPAGLPGAVVSSGSSGCAAIAVSAVPPDASPLTDGSPYLAVSATTPYNRFVLPGLQIRAELARDGEAVYDGELEPTIDPERGYHYGAAVDRIDPGDELRLSFRSPPVARYEGYERAFVTMPDLDLTL